jgi:phosphoadenosine phosphosulfate reductase
MRLHPPEKVPGDGHAPSISEDSPAADLIKWALDRFSTQRVVITTQFGMEGCALIDMCARHGRPLTVVYLDTMFLFPETYALRDRLAERHPHVRFVNRGTDLSPDQQARQYGPELWKRAPNLCCRIRKVLPMERVLRESDVWITSIRRSQSASRSNVRVLEWDWSFAVLKFAPLAAWSREDVWNYIRDNDVPHNPLHHQGYPSIGCTHCTARVEGATVTDYSRAGRWNGMDKTECGLHGDGI